MAGFFCRYESASNKNGPDKGASRGRLGIPLPRLRYPKGRTIAW
jgi:hypothetical protein